MGGCSLGMGSKLGFERWHYGKSGPQKCLTTRNAASHLPFNLRVVATQCVELSREYRNDLHFVLTYSATSSDGR